MVSSPADSGDPSAAPAPWWLYHGTGRPRPGFRLADELPPPPPWRRFADPATTELATPPPLDQPGPEADRILGPVHAGTDGSSHASRQQLDKINAAIVLRRPLLVSGPPGSGKSALATLIARELQLGPVLRWTINSRSDVGSGLYDYDPMAQIHDINLETALYQSRAQRPYAQSTSSAPGVRDSAERIGDYLRLGPLGTAFLPFELPRVLLIDEFDKGDLDLANDLLELFESGRYEIPELRRLAPTAPSLRVPTADAAGMVTVTGGAVECSAFPIVVLTSNGERDFPPAFLRRCIPLHLDEFSEEQLAAVIAAHFTHGGTERDRALIRAFLDHSQDHGGLAIDQLLNSVYMATSTGLLDGGTWSQETVHRVRTLLWHRLTEGP
ncbi:AAA family ATPase [Salinactinospora qingdaonensis]|uniref:MoxR family ATPase n=1 Tax=Salinactinospora qingdaonensis TaxID=702744 RepID=A0ABP7FM20_9ACTN